MFSIVLASIVASSLLIIWCWHMIPDGSPVRGRVQHITEKKAEVSAVTLERGWDLIHLAKRHYGKTSPTILDMVLEANPLITDINRIPVNQAIAMPPLSKDSFVLLGGDNRYTIHLQTYDHLPVIERFKSQPALKGKIIEIIVRKISPGERWYRLVAGPFVTREEGAEALSALQRRGISFEFGP